MSKLRGLAIPYIRIERFLSVSECDRLKAMGRESELVDGVIDVGDHLGISSSHDATAFRIDRDKRSCRTSYHPRSVDTLWIFNRMDELFFRAAERFGFDVKETREDLKFIEYREGGHFRHWHADTGDGYTENRKISISIELDRPESFDGGLLEFPDTVGKRLVGDQGGAVAFPSFKLHRVSPVTRGVRSSVVNWISGPPFR